MNIERDISADGQAKITFEVSKDELGDRLPKAIEQFRRKANIPGFRPGKAPLSVIKKRFGDDIIAEKAEEIAREYMMEGLKNDDLKPGGKITINLVHFGIDEDLKFDVVFPLQPEVELKNYKGLSVTVNNAEVDDSDVESELEAFRNDHAVLQSVDTPANAESKVTLEVVMVDPSGLPLINAKSNSMNFTFGIDMLGAGTDEQLLGISAGETRKITVRNIDSLIQTPTQSKIITPAEASQPASISGAVTMYSVEATSVKVLELPEADDDFAKKIDPNFKSIDDLREMIKLRISGLIAFSYQKLLRTQLINKLVAENPFVIHKSIIDNFLEESMESQKVKQGEEEDFVEKNREEFEQEYRWILLRSELIDTEKLSPEESDIEAEFEQISKQSQVPVEKVREHYSEKDHYQNLLDTILERKVLRFLADSAEIENRTMSLIEFLNSSRN